MTPSQMPQPRPQDEPTRWTTAEVSGRLENLFATAETPRGFLEAAAVLATFDIETIRPVGDVPDASLSRSELAGASTDTQNERGERRWTLQPHARRDALHRLIQDGRVTDALAANPDREMAKTQVALEALLSGSLAGAPLPHDLDELHALQIAAEWVDGLMPGVPSLQSLREHAEFEALLAPFYELVGDHFSGRQRELNVLSDYVDVLKASSTVEALRRKVRAVLSIVDEPPLFVYGPGGIGKSTLVAKFILDHMDQPGVARFPFAYLDFDRPQVVAEEPITLLIEALAQLGVQYPQTRSTIAALQQDWNRRMAAESWDSIRIDVNIERTGPFVEPKRDQVFWTKRSLSDHDYYIESFASLLEGLRAESQPFLMVLDTFEEVQLRSTSLVSNVFQFLESLQRRVPSLRTVLSGRVPIAPTGFSVRELALESFDLEAATAYLVNRTGVDPATAGAVARQVTGSPLTLKLAADLLGKHEATTRGGFREISAGFLGELWKGSITAQLYTRVLKHIGDPDVRKLAHPGLVLRRITPEIIQDVLAGPCEVHVPDRATADVLFAKLSHEVVLVTERMPGVLIHRPDLRTVMLEALRRDQPARVRDIHERAVTYYAARTSNTPEERAEEIYHRLSIGLDRQVVESRWMAGIESSLAAGMGELPARAQGFLAARLHLTLPPDVWQEADLVDWEVWVTHEAREYLRRDRTDEALALLDSRHGWTSVELHMLRVEALARAGRVSEAVSAAQNALTNAPTGSTQWATLRYYSSVEQHVVTEHAAGTLTQDDTRALVAALNDAFRSPAELRALVSGFAFGDIVDHLPSADTGSGDSALAQTAVAVVWLAQARGSLAPLVLAARRAKPTHRQIWAVAARLGLAARGYPALEKSRERNRILPEIRAMDLRRHLTVREGQICRISTARGPTYTGWLVGPDLVLTTAALLGSDPRAVAALKAADLERAVWFTFDAWETGTTVRMTGLGCRLHENWLTAYSPIGRAISPERLGYALVRIDYAIGNSPGADAGNRRGWFRLTEAATAPPEQTNFIAMWGFDRRGRLQFTSADNGRRDPREDVTYFQYNLNADPETEGAPVVDAWLLPIGLHIGASPSHPNSTWAPTQGVPVDAIVRDLTNKGVQLPF